MAANSDLGVAAPRRDPQPLDLKPIKARWDGCSAVTFYRTARDYAMADLLTDVRALVAEIERVRAAAVPPQQPEILHYFNAPTFIGLCGNDEGPFSVHVSNVTCVKCLQAAVPASPATEK